MTDTGQVPGEGLPESAGMVEQPGVPAHGAYTYLSETTAEDEDLLLLPGAQGAWGNEVAPPLPEPVVETVHEPGPHEMSGRDSGSVDLGGVRLPTSTAPSAVAAPRRPLHLGPAIPDASASPVRSLADRGPAGAPVRHPGPATTGPEYFDVPPLQEMPPQGAMPWGAPAPGTVQAPVATEAPAAETVVPSAAPVAEPVGAAQATMARLATEAVAAAVPHPAEAGHALQGPENEYAAQAAPQGGVEQVSAETHAFDAGNPAEGAYAPDSGQGPPAEVAWDAGQGPVYGPASEGAQVPGVDPVVQAGQEPVSVPDAGPVPEAVLPSEIVPEPLPEADPVVPAADPVFEAEPVVPVPDPVSEAEVPAPDPVFEAPAPVAEAAAPEVAEAPSAVDAGPIPAAAPAPEADEAPEAGAALDAEQAPEEIPVAAQAPDASDAVAFPVAPDVEQIPQPAPAEDATVLPEQAVSEQAQEPHPEELPAQLVPDPSLAQPAPPDAFAQPADTAAPAPDQPVDIPEAPQIPDAEAQFTDAAVPAPAEEAQPSPPVEPAEGFEPAPQDQAPAAPVAPVLQPLAAEPADTQGQFAHPGTPVHDHAEAPAAVLPATVPLEPQQDQPLGQFVPVEGSVPTTPHLAPTPPHPLTLPVDEQQGAPEPVAAVPAPREAEVEEELVQHAEDLDTRAADQEDPEESTAVVEEVRVSTGPAAPAYEDVEREAVLKVMRERRDIRNGFRSDPIPHEVLLRVLEAAHTAPSVGHSQPWDFVVIRSAETRSGMHELAMRQRDAYAKSLPKGRAKQFKELKIEAILDTPVNIVVTADPTRGGRHTLGRHTQPQMAPYSAALAVENLWLAARAEGLGVGWVSFFDEREMVRALGLPEHLEVIAYLCVGYVDEFPDEPELMQAGWSKRRPLSWVVHEETYGRRALPGEEPHDLLSETVSQIRPLDAKALGEAWERQKRMTKPPGSLGMLEIISAQLSGLSRQCPPPIPEPAAVAIFAGDHGVHAQGVTPWPQEVTAQMVANFLGGGAVCNAFAGQVGAEVCVVDVGVAADLPATPGLLPRKVRAGTSDMTTGPAMTREEAKQAIEVGIETARDLVAAGNKALLTGEMGIANTTASAALISVYTDADPAEVTGRGTGINDETLARKTEVVRRAIELHQPDPADPIGVLAAIGGFEHAAIVGLLLGGASLRTPVILDGVSAGAAALVARAIAPEVLAACIAGHRSAEPGHVAALNKLGLRPLVDLDLRLGEGTGALLALPLVQSTARAMH
ncbi:nicotinate-nucleotide--dimethylbenzimidazole phosphoribosyltransferase, partial [Streptomyces fulvoviolaceus]|uniref:nicotinate-nucleotide--dimethylbenzimidazole phosphoribosyltransferase n=1 Tax=Streptomyces fulvoviolaceus TaxID=285535 RepID=UPI0021C09830